MILKKSNFKFVDLKIQGCIFVVLRMCDQTIEYNIFPKMNLKSYGSVNYFYPGDMDFNSKM